VLQLEKGGKIIKMNTDLIHEMVIPAKKKIKSPVVLGLAGIAVGAAIDFTVLAIVYTIINAGI
jgi:hypothetical protein